MYCVIDTSPVKDGWLSVSRFLDGSISLEALIAMAALFVAVLIPLAIFLIDNKSNTGFVWDKAVVLTKILNAPLLMISLLSLTLPLLFWDASIAWKPFLVVVFAAGVILLMRAMVRAYKWLKVAETGFDDTYRNKKRLEYLKTLPDSDKKAIWSLTWGDTDGRALIDDRTLVKEFIKHLESISDKAGAGTTMLREFMNYMDKLQLSDPIVYEEIFNFSMKWASHLAHDDLDESENPLQFRSTVRRLFFDLMERSLADMFMRYLFFDGIKKYLEKNKKVDEAQLVKRIAPNYFPALEKIESNYSSWEEFPEHWKISIKTLTGERAGCALEWLNGYMRWITTRNLLSGKEETKYDRFADDVTQHLFTKVEPIMWSDLLILHWSPYGVKEGEDSITAQVRNFIELNKTFGLIGRTVGFWGEDENNDNFRKEYTAQKEEILELNKRFNIFPYFRTRKSLEQYIKAAKKLSYDKKSLEEDKRNRVINTLTMVRDSLPEDKKTKKKPRKSSK